MATSTREKLAAPFVESPYATQVREVLLRSCSANHRQSAVRVDEAITGIGITIHHFVRFKTETASVNWGRGYRAELRRYGKLISKLAVALDNMPPLVRGALVAARVFDEEVDQAIVENPRPDKYDVDGLYNLVAGCAAVLSASGSKKSAGRNPLEDEGFLIESLINSWESLTGRVADGTKKRNALARDGLLCFRTTADLARDYINAIPGKEHGFRITTENLNTVIDKFLRQRRADAKNVHNLLSANIVPIKSARKLSRRGK